ncbi:MAG: hypothetical protein LC777_22760, partial [Actinobacteria bacterium]|nr:hypothetical protein [Actinomycetota bacterium]
LARKGYWQPGRGCQRVDGTDFLGTCKANGKLTMADLDVLCWLCERYRERRPLDGTVSLTVYELGRDLYSRAPGGREAELVRASLDRLKAVVLYLEGKDLCHHSEALGSAVNIVDVLVDRAPVLPDVRARKMLRGDRFTAKLAPWFLAEIDAKRVTYLDWRILRELDGLAKRLWVYLEAETFKRISGIGRGYSWVALGQKAFCALGLNFGQQRGARRALRQAGKAICEADRSYESIEVVRHPSGRGWRLAAIRLSAEGQQVRDSERCRSEAIATS